MINWEELRHIHVIRKLEGILGQWFNIDIFFVDERGNVRNHDNREFKNPVAAAIFGKERGKALLYKCISEANEKAFQSDKTHITVPGPGGVESALVSRITVDNDFLGSVYAFCYLEKAVPAESLARAKAAIDAAGLDGEAWQHGMGRLRPLADGEKKYFYELIDLVAQEIVTFHTEISKREERISALNHQLASRSSYDSMVGKSKPMQELYGLLDKIKTSESTVLIQGENGTGKELIARAIHFHSSRKDRDFIPVNCSAFNENLLDAELFGYVKGSFTGAVKDRKGLFEAADRGTLFLDEIGDMTPTMQVKLLRVLQEGTFTPVGSTEVRKSDVRVLAATNRDLRAMIEEGKFREDLYYRINVINLNVPSLRDRKDDIPTLVDHFLTKECKEKGVAMKTLAKRALEKVMDYHWPGNIRQLQNEMQRLVVLSGEETRISADLLSQQIREFGENAKVQGVRVAGKLKDALEELEKTMIKEGLRRTNWNKSRLAKELGISRAGLIMKVEKYGLDKRKLMRQGGAGEAA